ncbi:MAG TPA: FdhF/YdeP family oxidoreductase [Planctomycetota bacterium]|nr:FdhF/YdeP family oxidoreductase [Planctomycetota bacterium]
MQHANADSSHAAQKAASPDVARAQTSEAFTGLKLGAAASTAGGLPAILSSLSHAWEEMGVIGGAKALLAMNQKTGFDCPSCAWPDPDHERSMTEFCENGAKAVADEATTRRVTPAFFAAHSIAELSEKSDFWLGKQGRITQPMFRAAGSAHYQPITWEDAFKCIARELHALSSPNEAVFYTSGRASNEAAFLYQLFVRQFGTNNLPDCSNMCHESSGTALTEAIGVGKGTVSLQDFEQAEAIFIIGQNPGTNHPRMLSALQQARNKGATIVSINPLPEAGTTRFKHPQHVVETLFGSGTELATLFLQVRINGDAALLKGIIKELFDEEKKQPGKILDRRFIEEKTSGFEAFAQAIEGVSWDTIVEQSGISREQIRAAAQIAMKSSRIICCWAMGLTQHTNAVATIQEIVNLLLLRGSISKPGAGVCPVRGHSNVQGDRTMGIFERPRPEFLDRLQKEFSFDPPREHGFDVVESIKAMHDGRAKLFFALGGNFLSATPDTEFTAEALRRCSLTVQVSTKLNRSHLITGRQALILPCLGRSERDLQNGELQFVTTENSMGVVQASRGALEPASEHLRSEVAIVAALARETLGAKSRVDWAGLAENYDRIRDLIERVIPGFEKFNERVRKPGGFYLINHAAQGRYNTATGKARFTVHALPQNSLAPGQYVMMTLRSHDQFNTTIYGLDDRYRGIFNERRVILMNADDMREAKLEQGDIVDLTSHFNGEQRVARKFIVVPYSIARRCTATYFPETNVLVPIGSVAERSNTPTSKYVVITVAKPK